MPIDIDRFTRARPFLYHLTARMNLERIRSLAALQPAADVLRNAAAEMHVRSRRTESTVVRVNECRIHVRDQRPLHGGNIAFVGGWQMQDLVGYLNEHVFFWPGTRAGPISHGLRHFKRYQSEDNVVLVVRTADLIRTVGNPPVPFCRYNSGSPRWSGGRPSPRGPQTFQSPDSFDGTPSDVVEVVFRGSVKLPADGLRVATPSEFESGSAVLER